MKTLGLTGLLLLLPVLAIAQGSFLYTSTTGDLLIKTGSGVLHTITCAGTAGSVDIRDGVAAAGGTVIGSIAFVAAFLPPVTITYDAVFGTGLYLDFTTTADVRCTATYR
jgi:hypothetical protein